MRLRLGTRASLLARTQSGHVADWLRAAGHEIEMVFITTEGDRRTSEPLAEIGGKGLFLKELEEALVDGKIDFAVHSLKDVPGELPQGLILASYSAREDVRDAWISSSGEGPREISSGARVGTGSLRRGALLGDVRSDLVVVPMRGNVDTRLAKLERGEVDAILLAGAGLRRLGRESVVTEWLMPETFLPAPGQGILGFECMSDRSDVRSVLESIGDDESAWAARAERSLLAALGGDCRTPLGAWARRVDGSFRLDAFHQPSGRETRRRDGATAEASETPESLGQRVAASLGA